MSVKFEFIWPYKLWGIERGVLASRDVLLYVPVRTDKTIPDKAASGMSTSGYTPGDHLRQWLELRGMAASAFSALVPCSISLPGQWIRGVATPSYRMACRIEQVTDGVVPRTLWFPPGPQEEIDTDLEELPK
jgi:hypothetical protein